MRWQASAPANIALIKYMGKLNQEQNIPTNCSFSYTLDHLMTHVELEMHDGAKDIWQPLQTTQEHSLQLSEKAQTRFLNHLQFLKTTFNYSGNFIVRSVNNFPSDCGLASSASSYAALTLCAAQALTELTQTQPLPQDTLAQLSRQGSGSSCRSFFSPWCIWQEQEIYQVDLPYQHLLHEVIVVETKQKKISSSQAHQQVTTSDLFLNRPLRASIRLEKLLLALKELDWQLAYEICWQEFWDMHALFETSQAPFGYMTSDTLFVLNKLRDYWHKHSNGPIITLDAGPNIHLLYQENQIEMARQIEHEFLGRYQILKFWN